MSTIYTTVSYGLFFGAFFVAGYMRLLGEGIFLMLACIGWSLLPRLNFHK